MGDGTRETTAAQDLGAEHAALVAIAVRFARGEPLVRSAPAAPSGRVERVELAPASRHAWERTGGLGWHASLTLEHADREVSLKSIAHLAAFGATVERELEPGRALTLRLYTAETWPASAPDELVVLVYVRGGRVALQ